MSDLLVFGSFVIDMTAKMNKFPKDNETLFADSFSWALGGKGINQAVAARRLGATVEMVGAIGKDDYGKAFLSLMEKEEIEHKHVLIRSDVPTGMAFIWTNPKLINRIAVSSSANMTYSIIDLFKAIECFKNAKMVLTQFEMEKGVIKKILEIARNGHILTMLNPAPLMKGWEDLMPLCDYVTPNEIELKTLTDMPTDTIEEVKNACFKLHYLGAKNVIATLGKKGSYILNDQYSELIPSFEVKAIDTIGAGDSFTGALAVKILEGANLKDAAIFATAESALTVTKKGAIPSLSTRDEVEKFLKNSC